MKIGVFAGSFDPITKGHMDIIERGAALFDKLIVAMGVNSAKKYFFPNEQRLEFVRLSCAHLPNVEVDTYQKLTAYYCQEKGANYIVRGLRNGTDFDYENTIANLNRMVVEGLETVFYVSDPRYSVFSSTVVREILKGGGDPRPFLPEPIVEPIADWMKNL